MFADRDPRLDGALGVNAETAEPAARVPAILVIVQAIYRLLRELLDVLRGVRTLVEREPRTPPELTKIVQAVERIERTAKEQPTSAQDLRPIEDQLRGFAQDLETGGQEKIGAAVASMLERLGRIERGQKDPDATMVLAAPTAARSPFRFFAVYFLIVAVATGAVLLRLGSQKQTAAVVVAPQPDLAAEIRKLRNSNAALAARVELVVRCGHEECRKWWIEGSGDEQVMKRDECVWVIDPDCAGSSVAQPDPLP